jgi:hypothetical protein
MLGALAIVASFAVLYAAVGGIRFWIKTERNHRRIMADMQSAGGNTPQTRLQVAKLTGERHGFLLATLFYSARGGAIVGVLIAAVYLSIRQFLAH